MKNILISSILLLCVRLGYSQSEIELPIADQFDVVTIDWVDKSKTLKTYEGVSAFCRNPVFRKSVNRLLTVIHEYDSLILSKLEDPSSYLSLDKKEEKKTLSDIRDLEGHYGMKEFDEHMREACVFRREIESNAENLKKGLGDESYDSKILVLETSQTRYFNKIDKLVLRIDEHLHVLHIDK